MPFKRTVTFDDDTYKAILIAYMQKNSGHRGDIPEAELNALVNGIVKNGFRAAGSPATGSAQPSTAQMNAFKPAETELPKHSAKGSLGFPVIFEGIPDAREQVSYALKEWYFKCPYCSTVFTAPTLKDRALLPIDDEENPYDLSIFTKSYEKDFLEYSLVQVIVCPGCLYASEKSGFHMLKLGNFNLGYDKIAKGDIDIWNMLKARTMRKHKQRMEETIERRLEIAKQADNDGKALFAISRDDPEIPRKADDASIAAALAIDSIEVMLDFYADEEEAKLRSRQGMLHLLRARWYELERDRSEENRKNTLEEKRISALSNSLDAFLKTNSDTMRVLQDDLQCVARRFFLLDELLNYETDEETIARYKDLRRTAISRIHVTYSKMRREKSQEEGIARRYYLKIDKRSYEVLEEEKAERAQARKAESEEELE